MKIDRLLSIIMVLLNHEKVSAAKLAEMFEVTPRTIYRDIETIGLAGVPIVTSPGVDGGISIMPQYKVDKKFFTPSDIQALLMGLSSISTTLSAKELTGTLEKVKNLLPKEHSTDIELKSNQITIDLTTWMGNKHFIVLLEQVKEALNDNKLLYFQYYDLKGTKSDRCIEPYQLVLKEGHWYLQGYCMGKKDFRIFKLLRISNLSLSSSTFIPRGFHPKPLSGMGWIDKKLIVIKLLVDGTLRERMVEHCGEENIQPYDDNQFIIDFPFVEDDLGYNLLLSFGSKCECLEPKHVRAELSYRINDLANIYK